MLYTNCINIVQSMIVQGTVDLWLGLVLPHAIALVVVVLLVLMAALFFYQRKSRSGIIALIVAGLVFAWYATTETLPDQVAYVTPYVATLLVLSLASQRLRMPAADGRPYIKGQDH